MENEKIEALKKLFKEKKWIKLAFLFGSQAKGRVLSESDYDLAVWPSEESSEKDFNQLWIEVERCLKKNVDLIDLPRARPTIAWEAFKGKPLSIKDERFYINKMLEVSAEADDFQDFVMEVWKAREAASK